MSATESSDGIAIPSGSGGFVAGLLAEQRLPAAAARAGAWLAGLWNRPVRIGTKVIVARHEHIRDALSRDLEFRIAPVNEGRIGAVNGPFVLGMDRGARLEHERRALYSALSGVDIGRLRAAATERAEALIAASGTEIDAVGGYARPVAAATAQGLFGITGSDEQTFKDVARAIFAHVFLNISGDKTVEARALKASVLMRDWFNAEIARRRASGDLGSDLMGMLLRGHAPGGHAPGGLDPGGHAPGGHALDDDGVRRTLGGMLVGAIDTTASAVAKIIAMIGRDPAFAKQVAADAGDPERLAGWCREGLRRWPHNPILLRQAETDTTLAGTAISKGDQIFLWTQAAMLDASAFPKPGTLHPDRPARAYLHFGGGLHPCAGRVVNDFQLPLLVGALVRRGIRSVGPVAWAGPFPDHLPVQFER
jgi:cytochrome P450